MVLASRDGEWDYLLFVQSIEREIGFQDIQVRVLINWAVKGDLLY